MTSFFVLLRETYSLSDKERGHPPERMAPREGYGNTSEPMQFDQLLLNSVALIQLGTDLVPLLAAQAQAVEHSADRHSNAGQAHEQEVQSGPGALAHGAAAGVTGVGQNEAEVSSGNAMETLFRAELKEEPTPSWRTPNFHSP